MRCAECDFPTCLTFPRGETPSIAWCNRCGFLMERVLERKDDAPFWYGYRHQSHPNYLRGFTSSKKEEA